MAALKPLSLLDRLLALWIILAMALGIILGAFVPNIREALEQTRFANVSLPIAIGLLVMMVRPSSRPARLTSPVANPLPRLVHLAAARLLGPQDLAPPRLLARRQLDHRPALHARARMGFPPRQA